MRLTLAPIACASLIAACSQQTALSLPPRNVQMSSRSAEVTAKGPITLWATVTGGGYLFALNKRGNVVSSIDTKSNGCATPGTVKVDSAQNVWVNCYALPSQTTGGGIQEYSSSGELERTYAANAAIECPGSDRCYFVSFDGSWDSQGHVFSELSYGSDESSNEGLTPGFFWWNAKDPSKQTFIPVGSHYCDPACTIYYMDVDAKGNLWFDFTADSNSLWQIGEIKNPTTHPSFTVVELKGVSAAFGGVYINDRTQVLNLVLKSYRLIYRYQLPLTPHSRPFQTLGPTPLNELNAGSPDTGSFNEDDSKLVMGDDSGWLDLGKVRTNSWKIKTSPDLVSGVLGASYTPSDKVSSPGF